MDLPSSSSPGTSIIDRIGTALMQRKLSPPDGQPRQPLTALQNAIKRNTPTPPCAEIKTERADEPPHKKRAFVEDILGTTIMDPGIRIKTTTITESVAASQSTPSPVAFSIDSLCGYTTIPNPESTEQYEQCESLPHSHTILPEPPTTVVIKQEPQPRETLEDAQRVLAKTEPMSEEQDLFLQPPVLSPTPEASALLYNTPDFAYEESSIIWNNGTSTPNQSAAEDDHQTTSSSTASLPLSELTHIPQDSDTFCLVPSRLSLLNGSTKYTMTIAEVKRRISPPENLNVSLLGGIMRRAKSRNGGADLRQELEKCDIRVPPIRRRTATITLLTSLTEAEATHFARDFRSVCQAEFPARKIAESINSEFSMSEEKQQQRLAAIQNTRFFCITVIEQLICRDLLHEFMDMLAKDRSPVMTQTLGDSIIDETVQEGLSNFSRLSHGFGAPAILAGVESFAKYLEEAAAVTKGEKEATPVSSNQTPAPQGPPTVKELLSASSSPTAVRSPSSAPLDFLAFQQQPTPKRKKTKTATARASHPDGATVEKKSKSKKIKKESVAPFSISTPEQVTSENSIPESANITIDPMKQLLPAQPELLQLQVNYFPTLNPPIQMLQMLANNPSIIATLQAELIRQALTRSQQ